MIATARALEAPRNDSAPAEGGTSTGAATALARATHGPGEVPRRLTATYDGSQAMRRVRELVYVNVLTGDTSSYAVNIADEHVETVKVRPSGDRLLIEDSAAPAGINRSRALAAAQVVLVHHQAVSVPRTLLAAAMNELARVRLQLASTRKRLADAVGLSESPSSDDAALAATES